MSDLASVRALPPPESAAELMQRAASGDRAAESALCLRFVAAVRTFARRRLRTVDAVEEFTQDVMVIFIEALRRGAIEDGERLGGFVLGICRNLVLDRVRQRERREALWQQHAPLLAELAADVPAADQAPSYELIHLEDCLSTLTQRARDVVRLSYAEARSHDEVATTLKTSVANARVLRHRTLLALRECLATRLSWEAA